MQSTKQQSGMFIIEALISVLLLVIGIVALVMVAAQSTNQVGQSKYRNDASYLASELIGEMWVSASGTAADTTAWQARVASMLPGGTGSATLSGTQVAVDVAWSDAKSSGVQHHYRTTANIVKN